SASRSICQELFSEILQRLDRFVYTTDPREELDHVVHRMLLERGLTLALAESCTGGLVATRLVSHAGASRYFDRSVVAYSYPSKAEELGVSAASLARFGAVSEQVALEMAQGVRARANVELAAAVTGIAGPDGATPSKPVGLVYWAVSGMGVEKVRSRVFPGDR